MSNVKNTGTITAKYSLLTQTVCSYKMFCSAFKLHFTSQRIQKHCEHVCSNNGGDAITEKTLDHWKSGLVREELRLFDMEQLLTLRAFNEKGQVNCVHTGWAKKSEPQMLYT